MSELSVVAVKIDTVFKHPNADKLDVLRIGNNTVCDQTCKFRPGDIVAHFPPDILIPPKIATQLGVAQYLKKAHYPGDFDATNCRVGAIRLRGIPSFGFVQKVDAEEGADLTERFHAVKYEPPAPAWYKTMKAYTGGPKCPPEFHQYTSIENYRNSKYKDAFETDTPIRCLEKIHGTNSRVAIIKGNYICGSHRCAVDEKDNNDHTCIYWNPLTDAMRALLQEVSCGGERNVIVFGEIYGSKVQFMDYGAYGHSGYAMFDISINGVYQPWETVKSLATKYGIATPPVVYEGPFNKELVEKLVDGQTLVCLPEVNRSEFKGREGIVITPLAEAFSPALGGRLILKAVSVDYLAARKSDCH